MRLKSKTQKLKSAIVQNLTGPVVEDTTFLRRRIWSQQAGAHLEAIPLLASFHSAGRHATEKKNDH